MEHYEDHDGINRNIVECKFYRSDIHRYMRLVLIETLWNVNFLYFPVFTGDVCVLIETLWNVN